jgi:hypothetical protein
MSAWKTFVISFLDGLTLEGIFGDLCIPGAPDRLFREEEPEGARLIEEDSEFNERVGLGGSGDKHDQR